MSGTVSTRWYFPDWQSDNGVHVSSLAARGLWMEMLCIAGQNKGRDHGFVLIAGAKPTSIALARLAGCTPEEVDSLTLELEQNGVFSRDRRGIIYSRRMVRAEKNRGNGRLGGNPNLQKTKENQISVGPDPKAHIPEPDPEPEPKSQTPRMRARASPPSDWPADYQEQFWQQYPRKTEKKAALAKLDAIRRCRAVPFPILMAGVARYAAHVAGREERYIKHPTTWLNRGCWEDEHQPNGGQHAVNGLRGERRPRPGSWEEHQERERAALKRFAEVAAAESDGRGSGGPDADAVPRGLPAPRGAQPGSLFDGPKGHVR